MRPLLLNSGPGNIVRMCAGALLTAVCAFGQFANAITTTTTTSTSLPPVAIGMTETVQVILTNTAAASVIGNAIPTQTQASCNGSVSFYNASGAVIGTATTFTVPGGQTAQVSLPYASAGSAAVRALIRPVVSVTSPISATASCSLSYSVATFDTVSGVTHAMFAETAALPVIAPL